VENQIRIIVKSWLAQLEDELGEFDQTTHGMINVTDISLMGVFSYIELMYKKPNALTISNASQAIHAFLSQNK
jgi:hypothetical protein